MTLTISRNILYDWMKWTNDNTKQQQTATRGNYYCLTCYDQICNYSAEICVAFERKYHEVSSQFW